MSIRTKLILFILALLAAICAVLTLLFSHNEWAAISSNNQRKNLQILLAMSEVCSEIHDTPGKSSAYRYFKTFLKTPEIIKVSCSDANNRVFMKDRYYSSYPQPFPYLLKTFPPPTTGVWKTKNENGVEILEASLDTRSGKGGRISACVDFSAQLIHQEMSSSLRQASASFFIILSIAFAIGCTGTLIITRVIFKPIETMADAARIIGAGRLDHRIPVTGTDEMGRLAAEFNEMAVKLKEFDDMKKDFVSSITHDLRSPVTGIELCADIIKGLVEKQEYGKIPGQIFSISEHSQRLNRFIDSLLEISKIESGKMTLDMKTLNLELFPGLVNVPVIPVCTLEVKLIQFRQGIQVPALELGDLRIGPGQQRLKRLHLLLNEPVGSLDLLFTHFEILFQIERSQNVGYLLNHGRVSPLVGK